MLKPKKANLFYNLNLFFLVNKLFVNLILCLKMYPINSLNHINYIMYLRYLILKEQHQRYEKWKGYTNLDIKTEGQEELSIWLSDYSCQTGRVIKSKRALSKRLLWNITRPCLCRAFSRLLSWEDCRWQGLLRLHPINKTI